MSFSHWMESFCVLAIAMAGMTVLAMAIVKHMKGGERRD